MTSRLAICVAGQLRGAEAALSSLAAQVAQIDVHVDVFFSVWNKLGRKIDGAISYEQLSRIFDEDAALCIPSRWLGSDRLWTALPLVNDRLQAAGDVREEEIKSLILSYLPEAIVDVEDSDLLDLAFSVARNDVNSKRMLYKIWRVEEIRRSAAKRRGAYSRVLRMRPDLMLNELDVAAIMALSEREIFIDNFITEKRAAGDFMAAAAPRVVDIYASLFSRAVQEPMVFGNIHNDLADQLLSNGIEIRNYPHGMGLAQEPTLSADSLRELMRAQRDGGLAQTPEHIATTIALDLMVLLKANRAEDAATRLSESDLTSLDPRACDGLLLAAAAVALALDAPRLALACCAAANLACEHKECFQPGHPATRIAAQASLMSSTGAADAWSGLTAALMSLFERLGSGIDQLADTALVMSSAQATDIEAIFELVLNRPSLIDPAALNLSLGVVYGVADHLKQAGRHEAAAAWQAHALTRDPDHPGAQRNMAEILILAGMPEAARSHALEAFRLQPLPSHAVLVLFLNDLAAAPSSLEVVEQARRYPVDGDLRRLPGMSDHLARLQQLQG